MTSSLRPLFHVAIVIAALPLFAQPVATNIEIGVGGGRMFGGSLPARTSPLFPASVIVDDGQMKGFWVEANFPANWALQVAVRRTAATVVSTGGGLFPHRPILAGIDVASVETSILHTFGRRPFLPYVGIGGGLTNLDIDTQTPADQDSNRFGLSAAVGAKFYLLRHLGVVFDVRQRATYLGARTDGTGSWRDRRLWLRDPELLAGVFISTR